MYEFADFAFMDFFVEVFDASVGESQIYIIMSP